MAYFKSDKYSWEYDGCLSDLENFLESDDLQDLSNDYYDSPILGNSKHNNFNLDDSIRKHTTKLLDNLDEVLNGKSSSLRGIDERVIQNTMSLIGNQRKIIEQRKKERYKDITNLVEFIPYNVIKENFTFFDTKKRCFMPNETHTYKKVFKENELYKIQKYDDDIPMNQQVYRLIKILKPNDLVTNETLVMKLVSGPNNGIYSLTKLDCKMLNIPYESGLQLFSTELNWISEETPKMNQTFYCDGEYIHIYFKLNDVYAINRKVVQIQDKYECDLSRLMSCLDIRCFDNKRMFTDLMLNDFTTEPLIRSEVIIHGLINVKDIKSMNEKIMLSVILDTNNF